jgi:hypothetical protein
MPLALSLLVDFGGKRFVLGMFCCIRNSTFELLLLVKQGTNRRVIVYRGRLFWCESLWLTMIDGTAYGTGCSHESCLGLNASHDSLRVNRNSL